MYNRGFGWARDFREVGGVIFSGAMERYFFVLVCCVAIGVCGGCASERSEPVEQRPMTRVESKSATKPLAAPLAEREMVVGKSVEGREIVARVLGAGADVTLVMGAIHGNEPTSAVVAERLLGQLRSHPELVEGRCVAILTVANPDGLARRIRTNKRLVDLNRNFPAANWAKTRRGMYWGGSAAASEPETVALMKLFEELKPARVVTIHSMDKPCNNYDGPAKAMAERMSGLNGYMAKDNIGYPTPGSLGSWAGIDRGIPIVTLELPRRMGGEEAWEGNRGALIAVVSSQ
jgi:protein MpaA